MEDRHELGKSIVRTLAAGSPDFDLLDQFISGESWLDLPNYSNPAFSPPCQSNLIKQRLEQALGYIKESQIETNLLIQLWVPIQRENQLLLTTGDQPFSLDPNCEKLVKYREVSTNYHFSAEVNSNGFLGLPGRVFIGRLPEWSPDVRFFSSYEYPRVGYAQIFDVHGTIALPVFERESSSCLGVVEVIMTAQKTSFAPELVTICSALQAVDLRTSEVSNVPRLTLNSNSYHTALLEILNVLTVACHTHNLPLAQTWVTCTQQGKRGTRHTEENYRHCISTVDSACYINDPQILGFHVACSEHHLLINQGMAGKAFTTNQPCFHSDISTLSKFDYPLSHHARMFNLKGSVVIRLRSTRTGNADFVLEFLLPINCVEMEEQKLVLDSLSVTVQNVCQTLRVVTEREIEEEAMLEIDELNSLNAVTQTNQEGEELVNGNNHKSNDLREKMEKQRTKTEKTVSLPVLSQYFAGSLKDAAKSLGVCPTTLKRICRQHGINRWPSRKIKKVDHTLKKLQLIIDSVHGSDSTFQLSSLYNDLANSPVSRNKLPKNINFPSKIQKLSSSSDTEDSNSSPLKDLKSSADPASKLTQTKNGKHKRKGSTKKNLGGNLQKQNGQTQQLKVGLQATKQGESTRRQENLKTLNKKLEGWMRIKATYGSEKVRLKMDPNWSFRDLKQEIFRRFNLGNADSWNLRYMDDDSEWILLTCDADLQECFHVHRSSNSDTIKIYVQNASSRDKLRLNLGEAGIS